MTALAWDDKPSQMSRWERTLRDAPRGGFPLSSNGKTWAGRGSGQSCSGCQDSIPTEELEYEIEASSDALIMRFHTELLEGLGRVLTSHGCEPT
jgi:hypothetical protein